MRPHTYLMTGATREGRLGYQLALRFLEEGHSLVLSVHESVPDKLSSRYGSRVRLVPCDFSDPNQMENLLSQAGAVDGIINAASEFLPLPLCETEGKDLIRSLDIHVVSPFLLTKRYATMAKDGCVVHVLDSYALGGVGERAAYRLAKSALSEEIRILAPLVAPSLRVNGVAPGLVVPSPGEEELFQRETASLPLKRLATVEEVYQAITYLLEARSVTGQTIFVDSGAHLR